MGVKEVAAGAAWLDENHSGWERKIDLGTLNIRDCRDCILGQSLRELACNWNMYSGYDVVLDVQGLQFIIQHGFLSKEDEPLWRELIKERFNTGNLSDNVE